MSATRTNPPETRPAIGPSNSAASTLTSTRARPRVARILIVLLIWIGFAARVWKLGAQSLWLDEGLSVNFSARGVPDLINTLVTADLHPPLFYLALHFWMRLAGQSEFAVRFLALIAGLPVVAGLYALGVALFEERAAPGAPARTERAEGRLISRAEGIGLIAAGLIAIAPFMVYYAQEARMYSALATEGVLSSLALWRGLTTGRRRWWLAFVVLTALTLYTNYFSLLILGFQAAFLLVVGLRERRKALVWLLAFPTALVLFAPWFRPAYLQLDRLYRIPDFWQGQLSFSFILEHVFAAFAIGSFGALPHAVPVAVASGLLLLVGLVLLLRRGILGATADLFVVCNLVLPLAVLGAALANNPKFTERYLIMVAPAFYLAIARGLSALFGIARSFRPPLARVGAVGLGVVALLLIVGTSAQQLGQVYNGPGYRKDDNRDAIAYIQAHEQPGDVIILMMDSYQVFDYYYHGSSPHYSLQPGDNIQGAADALNQMLRGHKRLWFVLWQADWGDPTGYTRHAVDTTYQRIPTPSFDGIDLRLYALDGSPHFSARTTPEHPTNVNFDNKLTLLGYDIGTPTAPAGGKVDITFYWKALVPLDRDYVVSMRLKDQLKDQGFYWWRLDERPAADTFPTTAWAPGSAVIGWHQIQVPVGTPPGTYDVEVGSYAQGAARDLNVLKDGVVPIGTSAIVGTITVTEPPTPPDAAALTIPNRLDVALANGLMLLGSSVDTARALPGGTVDVSLYWRADRDQSSDVTTAIAAGDPSRPDATAQRTPADRSYPTSHWRAGDVVVDRYRLTLPATVAPGDKGVSLAVRDAGTNVVVQRAAGGPASSIPLGTFAVADRHVVMAPPTAIPHPVSFRIGDFAELVGYGIGGDGSGAKVAPGGRLDLTLYWHATDNSGRIGYVVFAHLLDAKNVIWAQQDSPPQHGDAPTSGWVPGEYIADTYPLAVKPDAPPGQYTLEVGLYDPTTGARLPVRNQSGQPSGDRIVLTTLQVGK